jgi:hypothetical protein
VVTGWLARIGTACGAIYVIIAVIATGGGESWKPAASADQLWRWNSQAVVRAQASPPPRSPPAKAGAGTALLITVGIFLARAGAGVDPGHGRPLTMGKALRNSSTAQPLNLLDHS